jgi:hypothetical protein
MIPIVIRQELDPRRLETLQENDREAADEGGELDGNHEYQDLSDATWLDVRHALEAEGRLISAYKATADPSPVLEEFAAMRESQEDREALWQLDLGMAAPVMALNALGAHTSLSCNGGEFGGVHLRERPSVRFYPQRASVKTLLDLARESGVGLVEEEGRPCLYADEVADLQRFAELALKQYGGSGGKD